MTGEIPMLLPSSKENYDPINLSFIPENTGFGQYKGHRIGHSFHLPLPDKAVHGRDKKTLLPFSQAINNRRDFF